MKSYLISYDLNTPGKNYKELYEAIKEYGAWWHHIDSTWIVKTDQKASEIRDNLRTHIDSSDELLVVGLTGEGAWAGFNKDASSWLKDNL